MTGGLRPDEARAIEGHLLRAGLPHLIADYDPREDTLTRLRPALALIFAAGLVIALRPDWPWWLRLPAVLAGVALAITGIVVANLLRGRPPAARPERVGFAEAVVVVLVPGAAALALGEDPARALVIALASLGAAVVLYALASLGVLGVGVRLARSAAGGLAATAAVALGDGRNREQFLDDELERIGRAMAAWAYYRGALSPVTPPAADG